LCTVCIGKYYHFGVLRIDLAVFDRSKSEDRTEPAMMGGAMMGALLLGWGGTVAAEGHGEGCETLTCEAGVEKFCA
jgi:hypothetical protein